MVLDLPQLGEVRLGGHHVVVRMELRFSSEGAATARVCGHHDGWHCTTVCKKHIPQLHLAWLAETILSPFALLCSLYSILY